MDIGRFKLILYDAFKLDITMFPKYNKKNEPQFKHQSYYAWTVEELITYVSNRISPREATIEEYQAIIRKFRSKMIYYKRFNYEIFKVACKAADDVLDLINAMI